MTNPSNGRIAGQNEAYRKGLVLGLTMAEVGILIIFVLLLLLLLQLERESNQVPLTKAEYAKASAAQAALQQIAAELGLEADDSSDDFIHLVRVVQDASRSAAGKNALSEATPLLAEMKAALKEIRRVKQAAKLGGQDSIQSQVTQLVYRVANQEGQLKHLERRLRLAGEGKGERPCWAEPNGTIDYLYDVALTSAGIRMREHEYPNRVAERATLPAPIVDPQELLSEAVFRDRTRPLFEYSKVRDCRFFVVIYDATASHEKPLYKSLLRTVEDHFYKRLDNGSPPF